METPEEDPIKSDIAKIEEAHQLGNAAYSAFAMGNFKYALEIITKSVKTWDLCQSRILQSQILDAMSNFDDALIIAQVALDLAQTSEHTPDIYAANWHFANCLSRLGRIREVEPYALIGAMCAIPQVAASSNVLLGARMETYGEFQKALSYYQKAKNLDPTHRTVQLRINDMLGKLN